MLTELAELVLLRLRVLRQTLSLRLCKCPCLPRRWVSCATLLCAFVNMPRLSVVRCRTRRTALEAVSIVGQWISPDTSAIDGRYRSADMKVVSPLTIH